MLLPGTPLATKESMTVLSRIDPHGPAFKLLGIVFDTGLFLDDVVESIAKKAGAKLRAIFRVCRFYNLQEFFRMYKSQIW